MKGTKSEKLVSKIAVIISGFVVIAVIIVVDVGRVVVTDTVDVIVVVSIFISQSFPSFEKN